MGRMSIWFAGILVVVGVVDRIEGRWAIVEWRHEGRARFGDVPAASLPEGVSEGAGLRARLRGGCATQKGWTQFLRDGGACGGRVRFRSAPPWTGIVHRQTDRRKP